MKEIKAIIQAYEQAEKEGKKSALVTVVHLEGSSYRRPGARMLVTDEGEMTGAISGGCLEGDALRKALSVLNQQQSRLVTYDTSDEEDASIGVQLGCAGVIQVLMEPIDHARANHPVELLKKVVSKRQPYVLVTMFSLEDKKGAQPGTCLLVEADGTVSGDMTDAALKQVVLEDVTTCFDQKQSAFRNYRSPNFTITAFIEYIEPALALMIIGAGNDVIPLVEMANTLGWEPSVIDGRPTHAKRERFASACQILVSKPEKVLEQLVLDEQTVFVLMTHNYNYDLAMLKALVNTSVSYIGLLGPKKKLDRMLGDLKEQGITLSKEQLSRIYGPVGLEIGAETAEEIALSILAEIRAVKTGTGGKSLRTKEDTIHSREATRISEKHIQ